MRYADIFLGVMKRCWKRRLVAFGSTMDSYHSVELPTQMQDSPKEAFLVHSNCTAYTSTAFCTTL